MHEVSAREASNLRRRHELCARQRHRGADLTRIITRRRMQIFMSPLIKSLFAPAPDRAVLANNEGFARIAKNALQTSDRSASRALFD